MHITEMILFISDGEVWQVTNGQENWYVRTLGGDIYYCDKNGFNLNGLVCLTRSIMQAKYELCKVKSKEEKKSDFIRLGQGTKTYKDIIEEQRYQLRKAAECLTEIKTSNVTSDGKIIL